MKGSLKMYRALLIVFAIASGVTLQGCASMTLDQAVITHNTIRAAAGLSHDGVRAELLQGIDYAR
jgi:hypothetical protein